MAPSFISSLVLLLLSSSFSTSESRPLNVAKSHGFDNRELEVLFDGFSINSGDPSSGGKGYKFKFTDAQGLGGDKNSGPSTSGQEHYYTTTAPKHLGGVNHCGPSSPGQGHYYTSNAHRTLWLRGMKHSGPSPGQGNYYTNSASRTYGEINHSGPSPHGPGN